MAEKDFYLNENFELEISGGDYVLSERVDQDLNLLLRSWEGHIKFAPLNGIGIERQLNSNSTGWIKRKLIKDSNDLEIPYYDLEFTNENGVTTINIKTDE